MNTDQLLVERDGKVLRVTINRPEKHNPLSQDLLARLGETFDAHAARAGEDGLRAAVLRGSGDKSFAAGGDLKELSHVRTKEAAVAMATRSKAALSAVRNFPVPVIAALNGNALGGASELAVACDFRIAAAHAKIGFIQGRLGVPTAWGGGIDLIHLVGPSRALELLTQGRMVGGPEALALGLVNAVAEEGQSLDDAVAAFLAPILEQAPQVLRAFKAMSLAVRQGLPRQELEALETELLAEAWVHDDHWAAAEKLMSGWS